MRSSAQRVPRGLTIETVALDARSHETQARKLARLGRMHAVLAAAAAAAGALRHPRSLLREACRIAVEQGGFGAAWAGVYDAEGHRVRAVAAEGLGQFVLANPLVMNGTPNSGTLLARAIATGEASICNNIAKAFVPGSAVRQEALRRGLRSMAMCPLRTGDAVSAVLTLLAREPEAFDAAEVALLAQLAEDLSVALTAMQGGV